MLSDIIEQMINDLLNQANGTVELSRNDFALQVGCVPSQINYVISSRFTPERGYIIESRRGGGGYIRIIRKQLHKDEYLMHFFHAIGDKIDFSEAKVYVLHLMDKDLITEREAKIITSALSEAADETQRANIFMKIILTIL